MLIRITTPRGPGSSDPRRGRRARGRGARRQSWDPRDGLMTQSAYARDLDRSPANFQPLTPLSFLERAAEVFPDRLAIAHGALRRSYREFHARTKKLAS